MTTSKISVKIEDTKPEVKQQSTIRNSEEDILSLFKELPASDDLYNYFRDDVQIYDTKGVSQMKLLQYFKKIGKQLNVESNIFNPYISNYLCAIQGTVSGVMSIKIKCPNYLIVGQYDVFLISTINKNWVRTTGGQYFPTFFEYKDGHLILLH